MRSRPGHLLPDSPRVCLHARLPSGTVQSAAQTRSCLTGPRMVRERQLHRLRGYSLELLSVPTLASAARGARQAPMSRRVATGKPAGWRRCARKIARERSRPRTGVQGLRSIPVRRAVRLAGRGGDGGAAEMRRGNGPAGQAVASCMAVYDLAGSLTVMVPPG